MSTSTFDDPNPQPPSTPSKKKPPLFTKEKLESVASEAIETGNVTEYVKQLVAGAPNSHIATAMIFSSTVQKDNRDFVQLAEILIPSLKDYYYLDQRGFRDKIETAITVALKRGGQPPPPTPRKKNLPSTPRKKRSNKNKAVTPEPSRSAAQPVPDAPHTDTKVKKKFEYRNANLSRRIGKNSSRLSSLESIAADTLQSTANLREEFGHVYQGLECLGQGLGAVNQRVDHESESRRALEGRVDAELNAIRAHVGMH